MLTSINTIQAKEKWEMFNNRENFPFEKQNYSGQQNQHLNNPMPNSNISMIGRYADGYCYASFADSNILYMGNGSVLYIYDKTDPANPVKVGSFITPGVVRGIFVKNNYAYIGAESAGLRILDIADPANPVEITNIPSDQAVDVRNVGDTIFVVNEDMNLTSIDISDPYPKFFVFGDSAR